MRGTVFFCRVPFLVHILRPFPRAPPHSLFTRVLLLLCVVVVCSGCVRESAAYHFLLRPTTTKRPSQTRTRSTIVCARTKLHTYVEQAISCKRARAFGVLTPAPLLLSSSLQMLLPLLLSVAAVAVVVPSLHFHRGDTHSTHTLEALLCVNGLHLHI